MKTINSIILILFVFFLPSQSWCDSLTIDDFLERGGLYYKRFKNVPFSGEKSGSGIEIGNYKDGELV